MIMSQLRRNSATGAAAICVLALFGLAGCGGSGDEKGDQATATTVSKSSDESSTASGEESSEGSSDLSADPDPAELEPIELAVGKTGWWDGFAITLERLTAEPDGFGTAVRIDASFENLGNEPAQMYSGAVVVDGESVHASWDSPNVPGKGKAKGTIDFYLESESQKPLDKLSLEKLLASAAVVLGEAADNQTKLPLAAAGKVESIQPKTLAVTGRLTQGSVIVEVLDGGSRASYLSGEKGKAELDLHIKISCAADCPASGYNVDTSMFAVTTPGGQSVVADSRSEYCCDAIYPGTVSDNANNLLTFVVPLPGTGNYTLTFRNPSLATTGVAPTTLTFTA